MTVATAIKRWHGGQLAIVWFLSLAALVVCLVLAAIASDYASVVEYRRGQAERDSAARQQLIKGGLSRDSLAKEDPLYLEYLVERCGLQDTSFRAPTQTELRTATGAHALIKVLLLLSLLSIPAAVAATWIWLSGRTAAK